MPKSGVARGLVIACLVAILGLCGLVSWKLDQRSVGAETGSVAIGGPFSLTDQDGKRVTEADLKGKLSLIYFGYTFCPDACPTALGTITAALNKMGADADQVTPVFNTIDPERGTFLLALLAIYVGAAFVLFALGGATLKEGAPFELVSRESGLVVNNLILSVILGVVFVGTLYPLFVEAVSGEKLSVGAPYFNLVAGPLALCPRRS